MVEYDAEKQCILCGREPGGDRISEHEVQFNCKICGPYRIWLADEPILENLKDEIRIRISGLVREIFEISNGKECPLISAKDIPAFLTQTPARFDVAGRARKLLRALERSSIYPGCEITAEYNRDAIRCYGKVGDHAETLYFYRYLVDQGWLDLRSASGDRYKITPAGWEELQRKSRTESDKAFVAMWFDPEVEQVFPDAIKPAIEACGYKAVKIDIEEFNDGIVDRVIAEINESRFLVADLTAHRNGVYFEAGYAKGLGLEVIWACREDHARDTHFDAKHLNQIRWKTLEQLKERLENRIRATIGKGPLATADN
jgi:nucleoside 2-deoxyribosyltransferase